MARKEGQKIIKGKSGLAFYEYTSWCHRYKEIEPNGKIKYGKIKGFKTEEEAVESYKKYNEIFLTQQREFEISVSKDIMFKDYLIHWFENIYSERIESTTKMVGSYIVYNLILPSIEYDLKIDLVTTDYLDEILLNVSKLTSSAGYSARMIIIIMAMKDAVIGGYITYNPALKVKIYRRPKVKIRVLSEDQMKKFLYYAKDSNWYLEILLGLFCGLRKGEILGLKFSDIDFEENTITIERQLVSDPKIKEKTSKIVDNKLVERKPKTKNSIRRIKVPKLVLDEIIKRKELIDSYKDLYKEEYEDNDYISCQNNGSPHCMTALNECVKKLCIKLSFQHITVHGLRHMCATILLEQGATLAKIAAYLGHTSIHTTFEYYCEVMDEKEKILAFMNEIFAVEEEGE